MVIAILFAFIAFLFPMLSALSGSSRVEAGLNIVGMSADVARQWVSPSKWDQDTTDGVFHEQYNGTAALFTPMNEIRIVVNFRNALSATSGVPLEDSRNAPSPLATNGYTDRRGLDYMQIPSGAGVVGIQRVGSGAQQVRFLAPPFAIAFNESGQLNFGDANGLIYYDGNGDARFDVGDGRTLGYNPADWSGDANPNPTTLIRDLPFEAIECVSGVLVYDQSEFNQNTAIAGAFANGGSVPLGSDAGQWLQDNGRVLFFSPQTGVALRDEDE